jgi:hypothetical protein
VGFLEELRPIGSYAPINSKTIGKEVEFKNTRNYTAMQIKPSPLDAFFV